MMGVEFCQWSRTICQLVLLGVGIFLFMRTVPPVLKRKEGQMQGTMKNRCLSLELSYIPVAIRRRVLARDSYKCVWCGEPEKHDVSHFIQKRAGGETCYYDLITTCSKCKRKRHYDSPKEFISKLRLEELDIFREMEMVIKVIKRNGEEIKGEVDSRPDPNAKGFYITYFGNGTQQFISWKDVKDLFILSGRDKLPDLLPYSEKENKKGTRGKEEK